jgi:hypothetical protein
MESKCSESEKKVFVVGRVKPGFFGCSVFESTDSVAGLANGNVKVIERYIEKECKKVWVMLDYAKADLAIDMFPDEAQARQAFEERHENGDELSPLTAVYRKGDEDHFLMISPTIVRE